jgi:hypothetical protein
MKKYVMNRFYTILALLAVFAMAAKPNEPFPEARIKNGLITARLYLPDTSTGYYRGSRFDWSGVIPELEYRGHTYFGQWFEKYSPTLHDAIMGPVEDFYPIGYDEAKVGESFLKIGIGMVAKPQEAKYFFANPYVITNSGSWKTGKKSDQVEFIHTLNDKDYGYQYTKIVYLEKNKPVMVLSHKLKNTGNRPIETNVYNHNFLVLDKEPVGTSYVLKVPFRLSGQEQ